jgi:hypothetical protein
MSRLDNIRAQAKEVIEEIAGLAEKLYAAEGRLAALRKQAAEALDSELKTTPKGVKGKPKKGAKVQAVYDEAMARS